MDTAEHILNIDGKTIIIRRAQEANAERILEFAPVIFNAYDQVLTTPEEFNNTPEQERAWINTTATHPSAIILVAVYGDQVVGLLDFATKPKKKISHTGEFGISVHPDFIGKGIGSKMIKIMLDWARHTGLVEKVFLKVFATNLKAIALYKKLGFIEECREIKAVKQSDGNYTDIIQMYVLF
jgi:RimJ/RimL family protein N-acetyltransferase